MECLLLHNGRCPSGLPLDWQRMTKKSDCWCKMKSFGKLNGRRDQFGSLSQEQNNIAKWQSNT
jgi:hypothetical protein